MPVLRKARNTASSLLPGYADLQEIGGGAFATVYKAVEVQTGRPVALKILKVDTIHAQLLETFNHEIQALAAVSDHPNIVTLYRPSSTLDGRPVLVLELCRESLGQQLRTRGPLDPVEVTRIGIKIAGALETAHRNGFLHRDMKPQNILITQFGEPALADFGVAALQASAQLTAGVFGFTTLHAAPEMLEGQHLSPATDIYGLASTMYQLLTGRAPFASYDNEAPASVILRILRDPVRPLRDEHIPLDLADLLEGALSKEPDRRPRSALDFAQLLQKIERAQGWAETSFVAWGQEGRQPAPIVPARGPMGVTGSNGGAGSAWSHEPGSPGGGTPGAGTRHGEPLISSPGVVTPSVAHGGPAGRPDPTLGPGRPGGHGPSSLPPLLPPAPPEPPAPPVRPSLAAPDPGARNVVMPLEAVQGRDAPPAAPPEAEPDSPGGPARPGAPPGSAGPVGRGAPSGSAGPAVATGPAPTSTGAPVPVDARLPLGAPVPVDARLPLGAPVPVDAPVPPAGPGSSSPPAEPAPPPPASAAPTAPPAPSYLPPPPLPPTVPPRFEPPAAVAPSYEPASPLRPPVAPTFVDPDPSERPDTTSVYEQTMGVHQLLDRPGRPATAAPADTAPGLGFARLADVPLWAVAGIVVAVLVVVAAVLLLTGVI